MKKIVFIFLLISAALFQSCAQKGSDKGPKDFVVTIHTEFGDMAAILYDETPKHKANFLKLAKEGYYNNQLFHRVIYGFMIQGGDPDSKGAAPGVPLGAGGPGYEIDAEINPKFYHKKGALSAARTGDQINPQKKSSGSQFYIVQGQPVPADQVRYDLNALNTAMSQMFQDPANKPMFDSLINMKNARDADGYNARVLSLIPRIERTTGYVVTRPDALVNTYSTIGGAPHLDGDYTVFGEVIKGLDVIDKIAAQPTESERPVRDIRMTMDVEELPRAEITARYGYQYNK